jgi:hypothetical protein
MAFWTDSSFEPKRVFRWKMSFAYGGEVAPIEPFYLKKVTKPKLTMTEGSHKFLDRTFKFPGHVEWADVTVSLVDDTSNSVLKRLVGAFASSNYTDIANTVLDPTNLKTISKAKMNSTLTNGTGAPVPAGSVTVLMQQIDANDEIVESWYLHNPFIKELTPGSELNYEGDELVEYSVVLAYDWAHVEGEGIVNQPQS